MDGREVRDRGQGVRGEGGARMRVMGCAEVAWQRSAVEKGLQLGKTAGLHGPAVAADMMGSSPRFWHGSPCSMDLQLG